MDGGEGRGLVRKERGENGERWTGERVSEEGEGREW